MPSDIDLTGLYKRQLGTGPQALEAEFATDIETISDQAWVRIRSFDQGRQRWPADGWDSHGDTLPQAGDRCVVIISNLGRLWVLAWKSGS
jgi:hypothetical protein